MQHVIIGAGPAGVIAAETLRRHSPGAAIKIIGDEPEPPYSRMALPYYLTGKIGEDGTWLRKSADHYDRLGVDVIRDRVTEVDSNAGSLQLRDSGQATYDRLLVATGSKPIKPDIPGIDLPGVHTCWTLEDGRNIAGKADKDSSVVLMGAGFIGCIILEALALRGVDLNVIEMGDRMVPRMLDEKAGGLIRQWCETKGVKVYTSNRVETIEEHGDRLQARLDCGQTIAADLVIAATGVSPNTEFLEGSGIDLDSGILVDAHLQSSQPDIFAAGDACQGRDFSTGEYTVQAIQPTAAEHGRIAAMNMAGHEVRHPGSVNMNVLDTMGLISTSYGAWMGMDGGDSAVLMDAERYRYLNLQFADDRLIGAQALGLTAHVGVLRGLIQSEVRLGKWKDHLLQNPTRIMEAYLANTQAIGHNAGVI